MYFTAKMLTDIMFNVIIHGKHNMTITITTDPVVSYYTLQSKDAVA
jgi:hypothetical protein